MFDQDIENIAVPLPITQESRRLAQQFAAQQHTTEKAEEVFLNTLAVLIVNNYLSMLSISTNLLNSDSWNPVMRVCSNVADLDILGIGKLECRPVKSSADSCQIPMEVWDLRIGYVVVQIDNLHKKAAILGFIAQIDSEELAINNLRPLEELIDRLHDLRELSLRNSLTNLSQWLNNIFAAGWQIAESILTPEQLSLAMGFRSSKLTETATSKLVEANYSVRRAKLINLGHQLSERSVVLLVELSQEENKNIAVTLQVHPSPNAHYLPEALELRVVDSTEVIVMQAQARSKDDFIQLQFRGQAEEDFGLQIVLADLCFSEKFKL